MVTATGQRSGSLKQTIANIRESIRAATTPKGEKTTIITTASGRQILAPAGTTPASFARGSGGGGGDRFGRNQSSAGLRAAEEAARIRASRDAAARATAARQELERARQEAMAREASRKATAQIEFSKALGRARSKQNVSAQNKAKEIFFQSQKSAQEERIKSISQSKKMIKQAVAQSRKVSARVKQISVSKFKESLAGFEKSFTQSQIGKAFDIISGGTLTERVLNKRESTLNKEVENFNKVFGGRELSEGEFSAAQKLQIELADKEKKLKESKKTLADSSIRKIGNFIWRAGAFTGGKDLNDPKVIASLTKSANKNLVSINTKLSKTTNLKKRKVLQRLKDTTKQEISNLEKGIPPRVLLGQPPPIIPVGFPGIPKNVKVKFIGTQKIKGNKITTDIVFKSGKNRIGIARGVTIAKGSKGTTVVLGKSGVSGVKFPSGKRVLGRKQVFAGVEKSKSAPAILKQKSQVKIPGGRLTVVKRNIKGLRQVGVGKVATVKGEKFFHTGIKFPSGKLISKKATGINKNDFVSFSASLTKKDLSLIVGKAITSKKAKIEFIGLIKGTRGAGKTIEGLSGVQKLQYKKALQNVISVAASSLAKADKLSGLTSAQRIAVSTQFARQVIKAQPVIKPTITGRTVQVSKSKVRVVSGAKLKPRVSSIKVKPQVKQGVVSSAKVKQKVNQLSGQQQKIKQRLKQLTKQRQKVKSKAAQKVLQQQSQRLKQGLKSLTVQKTVLTSIAATPAFAPTPIQAKALKFNLPKKKKLSKRKKKPTSKQSYNVKARPLKKSKKGKKPRLIKINKVPLSKRDAKDLRNYITDTSLSRTSSISRGKGKPQKSRLNVPKGYSSRTKKKFRTYKIVKGKRKALPKGKVIERRRRLLDTKQEKRGITLKRRVSQIQRKPVTKVTRKRSSVSRKPARQSIKRTVNKKRTLSPAQLKALSNGRKKLAQRRKGGKK